MKVGRTCVVLGIAALWSAAIGLGCRSKSTTTAQVTPAPSHLQAMVGATQRPTPYPGATMSNIIDQYGNGPVTVVACDAGWCLATNGSSSSGGGGSSNGTTIVLNDAGNPVPVSVQGTPNVAVTNTPNVSVTNTPTVAQGSPPWSISAASTLPVSSNATTDGTPATQNVTAQDTASSTTTGANGQSIISGAPTAGSTASFAISGYSTVKVEVTGTWTGTITLEGSADGAVTWVTAAAHQPGTSYSTNNFTANFIGESLTTGLTNYRARATAAWTGTATVRVVETVNPANTYVLNPLTLRDGVTQSITSTIKAASTAAGASDTALVVGLSPNSPLPPGTNALGTISNPACTPVTQYGVQAGVIQASASTFYYAMCSNTGSATQYVQVQNQTGSPSVDAGPALIEIPVFATGGTTTPAYAGGAVVGTGLAFDVSSIHQYYQPDGGTSVTCTWCYR
jgi:hypothetical protein